MRDITLDGTFNSATQSVMAKLLAPKIVYGGTTIEEVGVDLTTYDSTLYYSTLIHRIKMGNIELNNTVASGSVVDNTIDFGLRSEEHTSELQSRENLVCRLLLEKKK